MNWLYSFLSTPTSWLSPGRSSPYQDVQKLKTVLQNTKNSGSSSGGNNNTTLIVLTEGELNKAIKKLRRVDTRPSQDIEYFRNRNPLLLELQVKRRTILDNGEDTIPTTEKEEE